MDTATSVTTPTASPAKLRDGSWGARVPGGASVGQTVEVRTSTGKTWTAVVTRVVWTGSDRVTGLPVAICATQSLESAPARSARPATSRGQYVTRGRCKGCRGPIKHAPHHRAMQGYCGSCAFDEFDC